MLHFPDHGYYIPYNWRDAYHVYNIKYHVFSGRCEVGQYLQHGFEFEHINPHWIFDCADYADVVCIKQYPSCDGMFMLGRQN